MPSVQNYKETKMFGSVTYTSPSTTVQKSTLVSKVPSAQLRLQSTDRLAAISGRRSPSLFPLRPVPKRNNSTSKDSSMSEHYTNRTYDRNPSPPGTFQPTGVRGRDQTLEQRRLSQAAVRAKTRPTQECMVEERHSEIFKGNSTMKTDTELKTRPRTADSTKRDCDSPNIEERVLHTVKSVLNRAVMEEGKIDGSNIGTILNTMTSQLKLEDNEPKVEIEIQLKRSRTRLVLDNSSHHATEKKLRSMVGIVRQEMKDSSRKLVKVNNNEPSVQRNYNTIRDQSDKIPYIDLPDPDCSKFNSILNQEEEKKRAEKLAQQNNHDKQQEISPSPKSPTRESSVGDNGQVKFDDELKIQNYLESLIKTMQYQMNEKPSADVKPLSEEAHCSCMIHRSPQKSVAESSTSTVDLKENKPSETKQKAETRVNDSKATQASNKIIRSRAPNIIRSRTPNKEVSTDSHLKLLRRNKIVQPGSKVDITYRPTLSAIGGVKDVSDVTSESSEDMYLRRRVLKSPVRKNILKP